MNIKFRAYDKLTYEMYEVVSIDFYKTRNPEVYIITKNGDIILRFWHEVSILQSTGLFDVNGKEIFEGDIIDVGLRTPFIHKVEKDKENAAFILIPIDTRWKASYTYSWEDKSRYEVLGNIYENQDLLK